MHTNKITYPRISTCLLWDAPSPSGITKDGLRRYQLSNCGSFAYLLSLQNSWRAFGETLCSWIDVPLYLP